MPPQRGRGRPKKDEAPAAAANASHAKKTRDRLAQPEPVPEPKKRGRRPKAVVEEEILVAEDAEARGRGRKGELEVANAPAPEPTPTKRAVRSRKADPVVEQEAAPKARGGRGRKAAAEEEEEEEEAPVEKTPEAEPAPAPAKRRGRQPKEDAPPAPEPTPRGTRGRKQETVPVVEETQAPAKRGRPARVQAGVPVEPEPKKRAGRPPKAHPAVKEAAVPSPKRRGRKPKDVLSTVARSPRVSKPIAAAPRLDPRVRSRLRMRTSPSKIKAKSVLETTPQVKAGRGRPRKSDVAPSMFTKVASASKKTTTIRKAKKVVISKPTVPAKRRGYVTLEVPKKYAEQLERYLEELQATIPSQTSHAKDVAIEDAPEPVSDEGDGLMEPVPVEDHDQDMAESGPEEVTVAEQVSQEQKEQERLADLARQNDDEMKSFPSDIPEHSREVDGNALPGQAEVENHGSQELIEAEEIGTETEIETKVKIADAESEGLSEPIPSEDSSDFASEAGSVVGDDFADNIENSSPREESAPVQEVDIEVEGSTIAYEISSTGAGGRPESESPSLGAADDTFGHDEPKARPEVISSAQAAIGIPTSTAAWGEPNHNNPIEKVSSLSEERVGSHLYPSLPAF